MTQFHLSASFSIPSGGIIMWGTSVAPAGFLLCDGTAVSRTTYEALFDKIGTTFGVGDGSTTFNVLNMEDVFPIGAGNTFSAGSRSTTLAHSHTISKGATVAFGMDVSIRSTSTNNTSQRPPYLALTFIIKT